MIVDRFRAAAGRARWPLLAVALAAVPVAGAFSTQNIFHIRDLGMYFWPRHLWLRQSWRDGDWPWWDPYAGAGQSAVADALNQFFLLPVTAVRLLLSDVPGFNFWIAAPFPLMAAGAWLWLRRHVSRPAACVGAVLFATSGPVLSTGNFPNLSWSVAGMPWILWCTDRLMVDRRSRRTAALSACVAAQALAGEPVTLAATAAVTLAYAAGLSPAAGWRSRAGDMLRVGAAWALGGLLAAVQLLPMLSAARASLRASSIDSTFWSLHPLALVEVLVPHLFGHAYYGTLETQPWLTIVNSGREPLFYSLYVGAAACVVALVPPRAGLRRWRWFWGGVLGASLACALGEFAPVYPVLQSAVPLLHSFRFPVKYLVISMLAVAALAAAGADRLISRRRSAVPDTPRAAVAAGFGVGFTAATAAVVTVLRPGSVGDAWAQVAAWMGAPDAQPAAAWLVEPAVPLYIRLAVLGCGAAAFVWLAASHSHAQRLALAALLGVVVIDPLLVNRDLHPMMPASELGPPSWLAATRPHAGDRVYVGGRVSLRDTAARRNRPGLAAYRIDLPQTFPVPAGAPMHEAVTALSAQLAYTPSAWRMREIISYDLPELWPREYARTVARWSRRPLEDRLRFLVRSGVRYCVLPEPPYAGAEPVAMLDAALAPVALYECGRNPRRVYLTGQARVEASLDRHVDLLLDAGHDPSAVVVLDREPPAPAGKAGPGAAVPGAAIRAERNGRLEVEVSVGPGGGYLNVLDTYDPAWVVDVDGRRAPLLRANAIFRAVRLAPGQHVVRFRYRPQSLYAGLMLSALAGGGLVVMCVMGRGREREAIGGAGR